MLELVYKEEAYKIMGACFEVRNEMGNGYLENVYQESLRTEFKDRNIPFVSKPKLDLKYKSYSLQKNMNQTLWLSAKSS